MKFWLLGRIRRRPSARIRSATTCYLAESLEARLILSVTYPAPVSVDAPLGNVALPAGVEPFNPPVVNVMPAASAPVIATNGQSCGPDQSLALSGNLFTSFTANDFGKDTRFISFGQSTTSDGTVADAQIQRLSGALGEITLDASMPGNAMYFVWAQNSAGTSYPIEINHTQAWWVGPNQASAGSTVSIFGQNLCSGLTPTSYIYLTAPGSGVGTFATVTSVNPYQVSFTVPQAMANGTYEVWVHNGLGGQYGWSTPYNADGTRMTLTVAGAINWASGTTYNAATYGAAGDGLHDDTPAIQAAITAAATHAAANGTYDTVLLGSGTFLLRGQLNMASNVRLQGSGKDAGGNWTTKLVRANGLVAYVPFFNSNKVGTIADSSGYNNTTSYLPSGTPTFITGTRGGLALSLDGAHYVSVSGNNLNISGKITLSARVNLSSVATTQTFVANTVNGAGVFLRMKSTSATAGFWQIGCNVGGVDTVAQVAVNTSTQLNQFMTVTGSYDGTTWRLYFYNGNSGPSLVASTTTTQGCPTLTGTWTIGADNGGTTDFITGAIQDARIMNVDASYYTGTYFTSCEVYSIATGYRDYSDLLYNSTHSTAVTDLDLDTNKLALNSADKQGGIGLISFADSSGASTDTYFDNLNVNAVQFNAMVTGGERRLFITNSNLIGWETFFSGTQQVFLDHDNLYGTYDGESLLATWNGSFLSITNCTGQDFNSSLPGDAGDSGGRFFVGSTPNSSNRFMYIANNVTTQLAPAITKSDQNAGEQILWDQNAGNLVRATLASAGSNFVTVSGSISSSTSEVVFDGGLGLGQYCRVSGFSYDSTSNTTQIFVDRPWAIVPDSTTSILIGRAVTNVAIYNNTLNGKSDYASRVTASTGVKFFNDGFDVAIDHNIISQVRVGVALNALYQTSGDLPIYGFNVVNNQISQALTGGASTGTLDAVHTLLFAQTWRGNTFDESANASGIGIDLESASGLVIEGNTIVNAPTGIGAPTTVSASVGDVVIRNNSLSLGNAPLSGSVGFLTTSTNYTDINPSLEGNTFSGFANNFASRSNLYLTGTFYGAAVANNGRIYGVSKTTPGTTTTTLIKVYDPQTPLNGYQSYLTGTSSGPNANLQAPIDILFTNTAYIADNPNPVNCTMYVLNSGNISLSKYTFDAGGNLTYVGDVLTSSQLGPGPVVAMTSDSSGNIYIATNDWDSSTTGLQPRIWKWDGTNLTTFIDSALFKFGANQTTRTPGGIAFDTTGRFYLAYNSVNGIRRFTSAGAFDTDLPMTVGNVSTLKRGPDGQLYFACGGLTYHYNPTTNTIASYTTSIFYAQNGIICILFGPKTVTDPDPTGTSDLYISTAGSFLIGVTGPDATTPATQFNFRDDVYPVSELRYRVISATATAGTISTASITLTNAGPPALNYSLTSNVSWITVGSGGTGSLASQNSVSVPFTIDATNLAAGTYSADLVYTASGPAGSIVKKATLSLTVSPPVADVYVSIAGSDPMKIGSIDVYTIVVTNQDPSAIIGTPGVNGVTISDQFASLTNVTCFSVVLAGTASGNSQVASAQSSLNLNDVLTMSAGAVVKYTITGTVASGAPSILTNTVTATLPAGGTDPNSSNNTASISASVNSTGGTIVSRSVFYSNSYSDGRLNGTSTTPTASDFSAIAPNKVPLLPGQTANFHNYTSFGNGINGIFIDMIGEVAANLTSSDFEITTGNSNTPGTGSAPGAGWTTGPTPIITVFVGSGVGGSDRVALTWANGVIKSKWIQITVLSNANTGLATPDVFYFGNAPGDCGNSTTDARVNTTDEIAARNDPHTALNRAALTDANDFNRDSLVNSNDEIVARNAATTALTALKLIIVPGLPNSA